MSRLAGPGLSILREYEQKRRERRRRMDELFARVREQTPQSAVDRRKSERLTLDDIEQMQESELGQRLAAKPEDDRSGFQRFFDLLDLPRNLVAQAIIRPALDRKKVAEAEKGALGLPRLFVSDLLEETGVQSGVGRAILGFVGDVAIDPLTYLSFVGGGIPAGLKAGSVPVARGARRQFGRAIDDIARGVAPKASGRLEGMEPAFDRLMKIRERLAARGKKTEEIKTLLNKAFEGRKVAPDDLTRGNQAFRTRDSVFGMPMQRPGMLRREFGSAGEIGQALTGYIQRNARSRRGINLSVPFGGPSVELASFDSAIKQLRRASPEDLIAFGERQSKVAQIKAQQDIRATLIGAIDTTEKDLRGLKAARTAALGEEAIDLSGVDPRMRSVLEADRKAFAKGFDERITQAQSRLESLRVEEAAVGGTIDQLQKAIAQEGDRTVLRLASDVHSANGLGWGLSPTIMLSLSKAIRGTDPDPGAIRRLTADTLQKLSSKRDVVFGSSTRGSFAAEPIRQAQILKQSVQLNAAFKERALLQEIEKIASYYGEDASRVGEIITTKLELGMAGQLSPDGRIVFAGMKSADGSVVKTADEIREFRRQAEAFAETAGLERPVWDPILDKAAEHMDYKGGALWNDATINAKVDEYRAAYAELLEVSQQADTLVQGIENYAGRRLTPEARAAISETYRAQGVMGRAPGEASVMGTFPFERHRTTNRFVWQDETGKWHDYFGYELGNLRKQAGDESLDAAARAAANDTLESARKAIKDGQMPESGYQSSVYQVNELAETGRLQSLLGGDYKGRLFDAEPAAAMANAWSMRQQKKIGRDLGAYLKGFVRPLKWPQAQKLLSEGGVEKIGAKQLGEGVANVVPDGTVMYRATRTLTDEAGEVIAEQGDVLRYLRVAPDHPMMKFLGEDNVGAKLGELLLDERVATRIEDLAGFWDSTEKARGLFGLMDSFTTTWKITTLGHPSWMVMNSLGHVMASAMAGIGLGQSRLVPKTAQIYNRWRKFVRSGMIDSPEYGKFLQEAVTLGDRQFTVGEILQQAEASGVLEQGRVLRDILNTSANATEDVLQSQNVLFKFKPVRQFFLLNHHIEQNHRLFTMLGRMDLGDDIGEAARKTLMHHYDYGDLTTFEKQWMRRAFPFYSWMRNNTPFMVRSMFADPKWAAAFPKLAEAFDTAHNDESRIPKQMRPKWFNEQLGSQLGRGTGILFPMLTPIQDLAEVMQVVPGIAGKDGIKQGLHYLLTSINPMIQIPTEIALGREFFTGREIGDPDLGQMSTTEFLAGMFRPIRESQRGAAIFGDEDLTIGEKVERAISRGLLAGRVQFIDPERVQMSEVFKLSEQAERLRNSANRATGDERVRLTVRLYNTWREMLEIDPETERVPKRVKERLLGSESVLQ